MAVLLGLHVLQHHSTVRVDGPRLKHIKTHQPRYSTICSSSVVCKLRLATENRGGLFWSRGSGGTPDWCFNNFGWCRRINAEFHYCNQIETFYYFNGVVSAEGRSCGGQHQWTPPSILHTEHERHNCRGVFTPGGGRRGSPERREEQQPNNTKLDPDIKLRITSQSNAELRLKNSNFIQIWWNNLWRKCLKFNPK